MTRALILLSVLLALSGCRHHHSHEHHEGEDHHVHHEDHSEHHENANEHMHQNSVEDLIERFESPERDAYQQPTAVIEYLGDLDGKKVMDIGAGSGYFTFRLAKAGASVIAADVEDGFLEHIQKRKESEGYDDNAVELRKLPYDDPLLKEHEVDMVLVVNTYHHIEDRSTYFSKVRKGIKPAGELVIIDFLKKELPVGPPPEHKISSDKVIEELKEAGFTAFDLNISLLPYQFILKAK